MAFVYSIKGLEELKRAVQRNPRKVIDEVSDFLSRAMAAYKRVIGRNPWKLGSSEGGAPVLTGYLRATHFTDQQRWQARIYPTAPYAQYVHDGTKRMKARPWLDFAKDAADSEVQRLEREMLDEIVRDLAK